MVVGEEGNMISFYAPCFITPSKHQCRIGGLLALCESMYPCLRLPVSPALPVYQGYDSSQPPPGPLRHPHAPTSHMCEPKPQLTSILLHGHHLLPVLLGDLCQLLLDGIPVLGGQVLPASLEVAEEGRGLVGPGGSDGDGLRGLLCRVRPERSGPQRGLERGEESWADHGGTNRWIEWWLGRCMMMRMRFTNSASEAGEGSAGQGVAGESARCPSARLRFAPMKNATVTKMPHHSGLVLPA